MITIQTYASVALSDLVSDFDANFPIPSNWTVGFGSLEVNSITSNNTVFGAINIDFELNAYTPITSEINGLQINSFSNVVVINYQNVQLNEEITIPITTIVSSNNEVFNI